MNKKTEFHKIKNTLKKGLFKVIYLVLKHEQKNIPIAIIMAFIQCLQITYLNFGAKVEYVWQDSNFTQIIDLLLKYFTITIAINNVGFYTYLAIFYLCFGIIITQIVLILFIAFVVEKKGIQQLLVNILRVLLMFSLSFGFWPIVRMQMGYLACEFNSESTKLRIINQLSDDIKIKRLINGQIVDIEDESLYLQQLDEEQEEQSLKKSENEELSEKDKNYYQQHIELFQTKSVMYQIFREAQIPKPLKILKLLININFLIIFIAGLVTFIMNLNDDSNVINQIVQLSLSNRRLASYLQIQSIIQDMRLINIDTLLGYGDEFTSLLTQNQALFTQELSNLISLHNQLVTKATTINQKYSQYEIEYLASNIELVSYDGQVANYSYKEAIDQLIAKAILLNNSDLSTFNDTNTDFFYYNYNSLNSITYNYQIPLNYHYYAIRSVCENSLANKIILLIIQTIFQFLTYCFFAFYFSYYVGYIKKVYLNFFQISQQNIRELITKCEHFLTILQIGEEDDDDDENINQHKDNIQEQDEEIKNRKQKKRKWKNTNNNIRNLMIIVLIVFLTLEIYFAYQYISAQQVVSDTYDLCPILNLTSVVEADYRFGDNALREYFLNPNQSIFGNSQPETFIMNYFDIMYDSNADFISIFSQNVDLFSSDFIDAFQQIYIIDPCQIVASLQSIVTQNNCESYLDYTVSQGLSIGLTKYFENSQLLKYYLDQFDETDPTLVAVSNAFNYTSNKRVNYGIAVMNSDTSYENRIMQEIVIKYSQQYLVDSLKTSIDSNFSGLASTRVVLFIVFLLYLFFIVFFLWIPIDKFLIFNLSQSRTVLLIIPLQIALNVPSIRTYLRILMKH